MKLRLLFLTLLPGISMSAGATDAVTYHEHIAPIIYTNCTGCHRTGEAAPFPFLSYEDVSRKAGTIQRVIGDSYMPPWHASTEHLPFEDVRRLSQEEIALFTHWVEAGKPEGDPDKEPPVPQFTKGWQLGEPDLVVTMEKAYEVPADGPDIYRNFVLPIDLPEDKWVKAIELRPSASSVLHHSLYFLDTSGTARELDGQDGKPGFSGMGFRKSGSLGHYVPGVSPRKLPGDLARPLPKGSDLVLQSHFHPSGKAESEQTTVGLFFADGPPSRKLSEIQVPPGFGRSAGIDIPAGEESYKIEDRFTVPVDIELVSVTGHAHYVCSSMKMTATLPDGSERIVLEIPDWDLDWQDQYYFADKVVLPAKTTLKSEIWYDNSAKNPDNPFDPPKRIKWGKESTDEMGSITLTVVPAETAGSGRLTQSTKIQRAKMVASVVKELRNLKVADRLPVIVKSLDADGDGNLDKNEIPSRFREVLIERLDTDKDDSLSPAEMETMKSFLEAIDGKRDSKAG